jgi:MFS family permease
VLSIRHTAIPIGGAIGGLLVPWIAQDRGFSAAIALMAGLGAVAAAGVWLAIPSTRIVASAGPPIESGGSPLREMRLWLLCVGCASLAFVQLGIGSFLTIQLVGQADLSITTATTIFTVSFLVAAAGRVVLGVVSDRIGNRLAVLRRVAIVTGLLLLPTLLGVDPRMDGALYVLALVVVTSCNGVAVAVASSLAPPGRTGATLGMQTTCNAAACTAAPVVLGAALEFGSWRAFEVVLLVVVVLALACLAALRRSTPRPLASSASQPG